MFVGGYWAQRKESRERVSARLTSFLGRLGEVADELSTWYPKDGGEASKVGVPIIITQSSIAVALELNRRDVGQQPIVDLGFRVNAWNGASASLSATLGCWNPSVRNAVVLDLRAWKLTDARCRTMLDIVVGEFDPDHAVVADDAHLAKPGIAHPWDAGQLVYYRGAGIADDP